MIGFVALIFGGTLAIALEREVICPTLQAPLNGQLSGQCCQAQVNGVCEVSCSTGYRLQGSQRLTCKKDGKWSFSMPKCIKVICPTLPAPSNGQQSEQCRRAQPGDVCEVSCFTGHRLQGSQRLTCGKDGEWNFSMPKCIKVICPTLPAPSNGQQSEQCRRAQPGDVCEVSCFTGHRLQGSQRLTCGKDGEWNFSMPKCIKVICPTLPAPSNGQQSEQCRRAQPGDVCEVSCFTGHRLQGSQRLTCGKDGEWNFSMPKCIKMTCTTLQDPSNGQLSGVCSQAQVGQVCKVTCCTGCRLKGAPSLTCMENGQWSGSLPMCIGPMSQDTKVTCAALQSDPHQRVIINCTQAQVGDTCEVKCPTGYRLPRPTKMYCGKDGYWMGAVQKCIRVLCSRLQGLSNGQLSGGCSNAEVGDVCNVTCCKKCQLQGPSSLTCMESGEWSDLLPMCIIPASQDIRSTCSTLKAPLNGKLSGQCSQAQVGGVCKVTCCKKCQRQGPSSLTCVPTGSWNHPLPTCVRQKNRKNKSRNGGSGLAGTCPNINPPINGMVSGICANAKQGEKCKFICSTGFRLQGPESLVCGPNGSWSGAAPSCY